MVDNMQSGESEEPTGKTEDRKERFSKPWLLKREAMNKVNWALPDAEREGFRRGMHNGIQARKAFAKLVTVPVGQGTPVHSVSADHIIFLVRGRVEFKLGELTFALAEHDLFFFPANAPYAFRNVGTEDAEFLSVVTEAVQPWPPESTYWINGEQVSYSV